MTTRSVPTFDVLSCVTGIHLGGDFHNCMDALYPGIMTLGCAAMLPQASILLRTQHPVLGLLDFLTLDNVRSDTEAGEPMRRALEAWVHSEMDRLGLPSTLDIQTIG